MFFIRRRCYDGCVPNLSFPVYVRGASILFGIVMNSVNDDAPGSSIFKYWICLGTCVLRLVDCSATSESRATLSGRTETPGEELCDGS